MKTWNDVRFFKLSEFDSKDAPGTGIRMDLDFVLRLDRMRELLKMPLVIESGYRTAAHNARVGGKKDSAHLLGWAADIRAIASETRFKIVNCALDLGFRRIGIGPSWVHLDEDTTKPKNLLWLY